MHEHRLAMVGIDGFCPEYMDRFVRDGKLPAIESIARRGVQVPLVSTLPACTPVAWTTMATGAPPSVHGITGFLLHYPGERLDDRVSGCYAHRCKAEPIWATATQWGKRSYVVKFPLSYPSPAATFRLDGAAGWGGINCLHEAASSSVGATDGALPRTTHIAGDQQPWLREERLPGQALWRGVWLLPALWRAEKIELYVALLGGTDGLRVAVSAVRDGGLALTCLRPGEWSAPLTIEAPARRKTSRCCFRIKVISCEADPPRLRLFNTTLHEEAGHSQPDELWVRHAKETGPIEEQSEPSLVFNAGLDLGTQFEIFELNTEWLGRVSTSLLRQEPWDLFMVQIHIVDWAHHLLHGKIDARHPDYRTEDAAHYEELLLRAYQMADRLVGLVLDSVGADANVVVLGDHGQDLRHTSLHINEWLNAVGLLAWAGPGPEVDWTRTRAFAAGNYIYLNLLGREPTGIVSPGEAEELIESIVQQLLALVDPVSGAPVILTAGRKESFRDLGGDGAGVGDIVFCCHSGYQATNARGSVFNSTVALREFTSGHDHFWPRDPRIGTAMFAAGPSFRTGYAAASPARLVDVAPTACATLGIPPPAHCEGVILRELLVDGDVEHPTDNVFVEETIR